MNETTHQFPEPAKQPPLVDVAVMRLWADELDAADVHDILCRVPTEAQSSIALLNKAIERADIAMAHRAAHRLKGMAGNLGAPRLEQQARDIEIATKHIDDVSVRLKSLEIAVSETIEAISKIFPETSNVPAASYQTL